MIDLIWILKNRVLRSYRWETRHELDLQRFLGKFSGEIFYDVGAGAGTYSLLLRRNFKRVIAVEPNPSSRRRIRIRLLRNLVTNVRLLPWALSDHSGPDQLILSDDRLALSSYTGDMPRAFQGGRKIRIATRRFDDIENGDRMVYLVKIDVEGSEMRVLRGMQNALQKGVVIRLLIEKHENVSRDELQGFLNGFGYVTEWVDPSNPYPHLYAHLPTYD